MKKTLKICAVFFLCALLAGCAKQDGYIHYYSYQDKVEKMEVNRLGYRGETVNLMYIVPYQFTLTDAEGKVLIFDEKGLRGDLLLLDQSTPVGMRPTYEIPYSDSFLFTTPSEREEERDSICLSYDGVAFSAHACGSTQISIEKAGKVELKGSGQIDAEICGRVLDKFKWLEVEGTGNGCITATFTETGAVVEGMTGECKITYGSIGTTYDCGGKAFEIDLVSKLGRIAVAPVEG